MTKKKNGLNALFCAFLPFYLLLAQYDNILFIGLGNIIFLLITGIKLIKGRLYFYDKDKPVLAFYMYVLLRDLMHGLFSTGATQQEQLHRIIIYSMLIFLVCINTDVLYEDVLYKSWKIAGLIFGGAVVIDAIQIAAFKTAIHPISIIPGYKLVESYKTLRPCGFFTEPASCATAIIPLVFLSLKRRDIKWAIMSTVFVALTTSSVGIILVGALWGLYTLNAKKLQKKFGMILMMSVMAVLVIFLPIFSDTVNKLVSVAEGGSTFGSRVLASFELLKVLKPTEWLVGANSVSAGQFIRLNATRFTSPSMAILYARQAPEADVFINTFTNLIFRYGIIGLLLFLNIFRVKLINKNYNAKEYAIVTLIAIFGQSILLNSIFFMILSILQLYEADAKQTADEVSTE